MVGKWETRQMARWNDTVRLCDAQRVCELAREVDTELVWLSYMATSRVQVRDGMEEGWTRRWLENEVGQRCPDHEHGPGPQLFRSLSVFIDFFLNHYSACCNDCLLEHSWSCRSLLWLCLATSKKLSWRSSFSQRRTTTAEMCSSSTPLLPMLLVGSNMSP